MSSPTFVLKVLIAVLSIVSARTERDGPTYEFTNIERYWTICPKNKVLYTPNQSEPSQVIEVKRVIDKKHPLLITAKVIQSHTGKVVYNGEDLNICMYNDLNTHTWNSIVIRFFKLAMMPMQGWHVCPIKPEQYVIYRWPHKMLAFTPTKLSHGNYEIWFTAKSYDGEPVFSTLKFKFVCKETDINGQLGPYK